MSKIEVKNLGNDAAEVVLYGDIGGWGVTASSVKAELDAISASRITLRIHSYGGDGLEGVAIKNVLKSHQAYITAIVDGVAASAASLIAVAGADELVMSENSELMIHKAWIWPDAGEADDLRKLADRLDQVNENYAAAYSAKAGGGPSHWLELMAAETWFSAEEAVQVGLADRVLKESAPVEAALPAGSRVFAKLKYSSRRASPAPALDHTPLGKEGNRMDFMASIAQRLGVDSKTDEATMLAALDEALAEQAGEPAGELKVKVLPDMSAFSKEEMQKMLAGVGMKMADTDADETESSSSTNTAGVNGEEESEDADFVTLDKDVLEDLRRRAALGDKYAEEVGKREAEGMVAAAIKEGKILAAKRDDFTARAIEDPEGMRSYFAKLTPGLIPVSEKGRGGSDEARGINPGKNERPVAAAAGLFTAPNV